MSSDGGAFYNSPSSATKVIDSHLHVWASPHEVILSKVQILSPFLISAGFFLSFPPLNSNCFVSFFKADKYPYFPGQEPTLTGHADFLLQVQFVHSF